jgi:type IV pilus assembly protein PilN
MFEGLKKKLSDLKSKKAENDSSDKKTSNKKGLKELFNKVFGEKISQMSVAGEEIAGLDISKESITVAQVSKNNDDKWILDKISYRLLDKEKINEDILESKDYISEEIKLALANAKITTTNVAISVPVTSAIIRVVTSPLMTEEELTKAIETDSLWENLVQLTDNLNDYSIFHQVINRNSKANTMEILFVASKLSDVNSYTSMIKKAGLNPVIMDVKCFTLKNAFDNAVLTAEKSNSAILEVGLDDNYLMIIHDNTPIITDVFLRQQEKQSILNIKEMMSDTDEGANVIRRYAMQIKQALNDYEGKYQTKINNIKVVSSLGNIKDIINLFRKNLPNTGILLFDPLNETSVPAQNKEKVEIANKSIFTSVMGLAFRKLDVFGYYKFVTAVKNINLITK